MLSFLPGKIKYALPNFMFWNDKNQKHLSKYLILQYLFIFAAKFKINIKTK